MKWQWFAWKTFIKNVLQLLTLSLFSWQQLSLTASCVVSPMKSRALFRKKTTKTETKKKKSDQKTLQGHCVWNMCLVTWSWLPKGIRIHIFVLLYTWVAWIMYCSLSLFGLCSLAGQPSKRFTLNSSYIQHKSHLASEDQSYINQQALRNW